MLVIRWRKYIHELSASFLKITKVCEDCKNKSKKMMTTQEIFLVEG